MNIGRVKTRSAYFALVLIALLAASPWAARSEAADAARGEYIVRAAGCISCHTQKDGKGEFLAGGRALVSPYGNFYSSNITPDAETGIGAWSDSDFVHAMRHGESPYKWSKEFLEAGKRRLAGDTARAASRAMLRPCAVKRVI